MIKFDKGEIKHVWIEVSERDDAAFTISSATFEVFDDAGTSVQTSTAASIDGAKIYGLVDTSTVKFTAGESYEVKFTFVIGSETYIDVVHIKLEETLL